MYLSKPALLYGLTFNCVKFQMKYLPLSAVAAGVVPAVVPAVTRVLGLAVAAGVVPAVAGGAMAAVRRAVGMGAVVTLRREGVRRRMAVPRRPRWTGWRSFWSRGGTCGAGGPEVPLRTPRPGVRPRSVGRMTPWGPGTGWWLMTR